MTNGALTCSAQSCVHNMTGLCSANVIHVHGAGAHSSEYTNCGTFAEKGLKNTVTHMLNMNIPGEVRQLFNSTEIQMSPKIKCDAIKCRYNDNRDCHANFVQIQGPGAMTSANTECETFIE
ncbi:MULTISPECIES: DUF1540 domain-containing protein [Clostridium]|uniref:DUF1540 domain-containing protein n=1 Tax=Clostridium TaxID=1485 RepID=UPI00031E9ECF|nr:MULTISPECIES: DUF1540 domain-containing protein [Clostridium]